MTSENKEQQKLGNKFIFVMWVSIMIMVFYLFDNLLVSDHNPNQQVNFQKIGQQNIVTLKRNRYGQYVTHGKINNHPVTFLVDTGASDISIPDKLAKKLNLKYGPKREYSTANGNIFASITTLKSVSIGNIKLQNVHASISPDPGIEDVLLGMSFLKYIEFTQRGDTLILRQ